MPYVWVVDHVLVAERVWVAHDDRWRLAVVAALARAVRRFKELAVLLGERFEEHAVNL